LKISEEDAKKIWENHLRLYTVIITKEEKKELDEWLKKDNHWLYLESWWGIENETHYYARVKEAKEQYEKYEK
jgi:hypothetical protein